MTSRAKRSGRSLVSLADLSPSELARMVERAGELKKSIRGQEALEVLRGYIVGLLFEKPSTRTRTSFEVATMRMGGHSIYLSSNELQLSRGEPVKDTARILGSYLDVVVARVNSQRTVEEFAAFAGVPVINGLSELEHPTQIIGDLLTIKEAKGSLRGLRLGYVGDGDNVCNSLLLGAAMVGMSMTVACPQNYRPNEEILEEAQRIGDETGGVDIKVVVEPEAAAAEADVVYTDVWVSMGDEAEKDRRLRSFRRYQVNSKLLQVSKPSVSVMHCLPAHRGLEITDDVLEGKHSIAWAQGENKLYGAAAVLEWATGAGTGGSP